MRKDPKSTRTGAVSRSAIAALSLNDVAAGAVPTLVDTLGAHHAIRSAERAVSASNALIEQLAALSADSVLTMRNATLRDRWYVSTQQSSDSTIEISVAAARTRATIVSATIAARRAPPPTHEAKPRQP